MRTERVRCRPLYLCHARIDAASIASNSEMTKKQKKQGEGDHIGRG
jgi:hypothetical protein